MVLTDNHETVPYPAATMEAGQATNEKLLYLNLPQIKTPIPVSDPVDNTTPQNDKVAKVSGATSDHKIAPARKSVPVVYWSFAKLISIQHEKQVSRLKYETQCDR